MNTRNASVCSTRYGKQHAEPCCRKSGSNQCKSVCLRSSCKCLCVLHRHMQGTLAHSLSAELNTLQVLQNEGRTISRMASFLTLSRSSRPCFFLSACISILVESDLSNTPLPHSCGITCTNFLQALLRNEGHLCLWQEHIILTCPGVTTNPRLE